MANREREQFKWRSEGMAQALRIAEKEGIEGLRQNLHARGIMGSDFPYDKEALKTISNNLKTLQQTSIRITIAACLKNVFEFGPKRIKRFFDEYDKFLAYLDHGWIEWADVVSGLKKDLVGVDYSENPKWLVNAKDYSRPNSDDMYTPDDFISPQDWSQLLQDLGYTDWQDPVTPSKHYIRSGDGSLKLFEYDGQKDQVRMYDFLDGIRYTVLAWGLADEGEGET